MKKPLYYIWLMLLTFWHYPQESLAQSWTNLGNGMNNYVEALAANSPDNLYVGGWFTTAGGIAASRIAKWNAASWTNLGSGMINTSESSHGLVYALAIDSDGNLYAGGYFTNAGGVAANRIAKWNGSSWTNLGSGMNDAVEALAIDVNSNLYAGGFFTTAGGIAASRIAKWNGVSWTNLGSGMADGPTRTYVETLAIDTNGVLYAGGEFLTAGGVAANFIAKWNGTTWTNLSNGMNNLVYALALDDSGNLYAGGYFSTAGGAAANYIAKWNGTSWTNLGSGMNHYVFALAFDSNSNLYAGGMFTTAGGVTVNRIAKWGAVQALAPDAPTGVSASDGTYTDRIRVSWNAVSGASGYQVFRNTSNSTNGLTVYATTTSTAHDDTDVSFGVNYYYWVKATNALATSAFSDSDIGYVGLAAPGGVSASDGTYSNLVRVSWNAVSGASGYQVFRNTSNSTNGLTVYATTTSTAYDDTDVSFGVNYYYWVKATNALATSAFSDSDIGYLGSTETTLAAPGGVSASDGTYSNLVRVTWDAVSGALYYELWRNTSNNSALAAVLAQTTNTLTYDDADVSAGTTYYYWVKAKNSQTTSAFSNPDSGYASYVPPTPAGNSDLSLMALLFLPATLTTNQHPGAVSVQLVNYGPMNLTSPDTRVAIDFYLSANTTFGDEDDISIGDYTSDQTLGASSYTTIVLPASGRQGLTVPAMVSAGTYYIFAQVRHAYPSSLVDPDESNNYVMREGAITITVESGDGDGGGTDTGYHLINDYDGDGKSDLALYKEATGEWQILLSGSGYEQVSFVLGGNNYQPVIADYDGDGKADPAVYNQNTGEWQALLSAGGHTTISYALGGPNYTPVPIDYDGDGLADLAVYNQKTGEWRMLLSSLDYEPQTLTLGGQGYVPVPADYDGDGISDPAVYRLSTGTWQLKLSTYDYWTFAFQFGGSGAIPIPADYDGDGKADPAAYKETSGEWNVMMSRMSYLMASGIFGGPGYVPVPADYDGDGLTDPVVYNESIGKLQILLSGSDYELVIIGIGGPGFEPVGVWQRH